MKNYDNAPFFYFEFADDGVLHFVNRELCETLQYFEEDLVGKPIDILLPVASRIFYNTHLLPLLTLHGFANEIFLFLQDVNGQQIPLLVNARKNRETNLNLVAGIIVHNRKKFEQELIKAKQQLEKAISENTDLKQAQQQLELNSIQLDATVYKLESQRLDMLQFTKMLTHDLQEPLRKLFFYGDMLGGQLPLADERIQQTWGKIVQAYQRLSVVLTGLQNYVWLSDHALDRKDLSLNIIITELQDWLNASFSQHPVRLEHTEFSTIQADPILLMRLLHGVVEDLIKTQSSSEAYFLTIKTFVTKRNVFRGLEDRYNYQDFDAFTIAHTNEAAQLSMQPDKTIATEYSVDFSSPLSLAFYRRIMDLHGGFLEINSNMPSGIRICLYFPIKQREDVDANSSNRS